MKLIDFYACSLWRYAKNVLEYCPRGYIEGGYYFSIRPSTACIIRVRVLFEGGSYMRKYSTWYMSVVYWASCSPHSLVHLQSACHNYVLLGGLIFINSPHRVLFYFGGTLFRQPLVGRSQINRKNLLTFVVSKSWKRKIMNADSQTTTMILT